MSTPSPQLARRIEGMSGNVIREILKLTQQPDVISFAGGLPSPDSFPVEALQRITAAGFGPTFHSLLQYATTEGYGPLREFLAQWVEDRGIKASPDEICILTGSQQGIDLACKALLNPSDVVLVERPTYLAALQIIRLYEGRAVAVPGDEHGMDPEALKAAIAKERPKLIYLVPTFRNPSGETWSVERRRQIVEIAAEAGVTIIEDDPYGLLRYDGPHLPTVKSFDPGNTVIYLGSFSKIVSPGLRVGYAIAHPSILRPMTIGKQAVDVHTTTYSQWLINEFCRSAELEPHLDRVKKDYKFKRDRMLQAIETHFPPGVRWTRPEGGLFLWVTLPPGASSTALLEESVKQKVAFIPGTPFFTDGSGDNAMRLNFSNSTPEQIDQGISRMGKVLSEWLTTLHNS